MFELLTFPFVALWYIFILVLLLAIYFFVARAIFRVGRRIYTNQEVKARKADYIDIDPRRYR